jgi:hypothetical protein
MTAAYAAWPPGMDPAPLRREVAHAHEQFEGQCFLEVLGPDRGRLTIRHGHVELSRRHSEIHYLLSIHPRGLTGEELGVRPYEEASARVTVRAEMSRLRRLLGGDLLASRPYRLLEPMATDAEEVRGLLARGAYRQAFATYAGPLLPRSEAPEVVEARDALACEVRSCLLQHADAHLPVAWLNRPENADDLELLQTAEQRLPSVSPQRAMMQGRRERLAW